MGFLQNLLLKYKLSRDEKFLLTEGLRKAREQGLKIKSTELVLKPKTTRQKMHLYSRGGQTDVTPLIQLVAEDYPEVTRRYLSNREKLRGCISSKTRVS